MHHFLTAAGLIALIGFAFGYRTAQVVAIVLLIVPPLFFAIMIALYGL
jgi:uncharacterized membrane protein (Fun14 family)